MSSWPPWGPCTAREAPTPFTHDWILSNSPHVSVFQTSPLLLQLFPLYRLHFSLIHQIPLECRCPEDRTPSPSPLYLSFLVQHQPRGGAREAFLNKYLFACLAASNLSCSMQILSCGMWTLKWSMWDLVLWPGIEPRPPALAAGSLSHWTTKKAPGAIFWLTNSKISLLSLPVDYGNRVVNIIAMVSMLMELWECISNLLLCKKNTPKCESNKFYYLTFFEGCRYRSGSAERFRPSLSLSCCQAIGWDRNYLKAAESTSKLTH